MTHKQRMIEHFLYLRVRDQDYARSAVLAYVALSNCPYPDIAQDVREAWTQLNGSGSITKPKDSA